jgi:hypothetical protein
MNHAAAATHDINGEITKFKEHADSQAVFPTALAAPSALCATERTLVGQAHVKLSLKKSTR